MQCGGVSLQKVKKMVDTSRTVLSEHVNRNRNEMLSEFTCLKFAVMDNRVDSANLLIGTGAFLKDVDEARCLLNLCILNDSVEMLDCLFKGGVLDSLEFDDIAYKMHTMASNGSHGFLRACLDHAVDNAADISRLLAHKDSTGKTLLLNAVTSYNPVNILTVKMLIDHGADVLQVDGDGQTAGDLLRLNRESSCQQSIALLDVETSKILGMGHMKLVSGSA